MTPEPGSIHGRLRVAGMLVIAGLTVTFASLLWDAPLSFLLFATVGIGLVVLGTLWFLVSLVA